MGLVVYTGGSFDLFHAGHIAFLRYCKELVGPSGKVVVSLNTDEFIVAYKGKGLVMSYDERAVMLEACRYVDRVIPNVGGADSKPAIERVDPNIIAIGSDWARKDYHKQMGFDQDWLDERDISLIYIPYTAGISSTEIKARLAKR
jgi:glycerol-3-phosphate cytidylyltransferase